MLNLLNAEDSYVQLGDLYLQKGVMLKDDGKTEEANQNFNMAIKMLEEGRQKYPENGDILLLTF